MIQLIAILSGLIMGSFLSMLIPRLHHNQKGILMGRSQCPSCKKTLTARELIPLLSWLIQKGKCRHCSKKIPLWYPAIELTTTLSFLGLTTLSNDPLQLISWAFPLWIFLYIFFYDLRYKEIHDIVLIPGILIMLGLSFITGNIQSSLIGLAIGSGFFGIQYLASKGRWIGSGDIFIGAFMGATLGWDLTLVAIFLSYVIGSVIGIGLLLTQKAKGETAVPLGPFLVLGSVIAFLYGDPLIELYLGL